MFNFRKYSDIAASAALLSQMQVNLIVVGMGSSRTDYLTALSSQVIMTQYGQAMADQVAFSEKPKEIYYFTKQRWFYRNRGKDEVINY